MSSLRESKLRHARYYCDLAQQYRTNNDQANIEINYGNIYLGIEVAEKYKDYVTLADYMKAISDNWAGSFWDQYKHFIYLVLENARVDSSEKIRYLTNLARIEESQGNYDFARKILEEKFQFLISLKDNGHSYDLFEVAMKIVDLAKRQDNFENLESILLQMLECAIRQRDVKQQVDVLLELALLPAIINNYEKSTEYIIRSLNLAHQVGYKVGVLDTLIASATLCLFHSRIADAKAAYREAWDMAATINDKYRVNEIKKQKEFVGEFMDKKVFISYNNANRNFVEKLANNIQNAGLSVWWDEWEIKVGDSIFQKVNDGISTSANLVVVLSTSSVNSSWVQREVGSALMKQLSSEKSITILPVLLEDCDIPPLLRDILWADFRKSYQSGLTQLLKALR